jgi:hypothetical protein
LQKRFFIQIYFTQEKLNMSQTQDAPEIAMKPSDMLLFLEGQIPAKNTVLIKGAPGIGKSDIVEQACKNVGAELIISHPVVADPTDHKGMPFVVDGKAEFLPFGDLRKIMQATSPTVYFFDDLGQAQPAVQKSCMQLLLARQINGKKISDHVSFLAATNRKKDKAGITGILEPVKSRFRSIVELVSDLNDWVRWALDQNDVPIELISFIRWRPEMLDNFIPTNEMKNTPCPRTIYNAGKLLNSKLPKHLEFAAFAGAAGVEFATEFTGFLRIFRQLPDPDAIIMSPDTAKVPEDPAAQYAVCGAIAQKASVDNMESITTYADRMPPEFSVCMINYAQKRNPDVVETRAFVDWASKNQDVIM